MFDTILKVIVTIGIPAIMGACVCIGKKLQILDTVQKDVTETKNDCGNIWNKINGHGEDICSLKISIYGKPGSPMIVNEPGKKLLEDCGFYKIYPELQKKIFKLMDTWELRTLYDYEKEAKTALKELENNPLIDPLKEYVVSHPTKVSLDLIFTVASWVVRDDYDKYKKEQL